MAREKFDINMQNRKQKNLDTDLTHFTEVSSKWIIDLNKKCKSQKHFLIVSFI